MTKESKLKLIGLGSPEYDLLPRSLSFKRVDKVEIPEDAGTK